EKTINASRKLLFNNFSNDLIAHVFTFIPCRNIYRCRLVSKRYRKIINNSLIISNSLIRSKDRKYLELFGLHLKGADFSQIDPKVKNIYIDSLEGVNLRNIPENISFLSLHRCELKNRLTDIPFSINELHLFKCELEDINLQDIPEHVSFLSLHGCELKNKLTEIPFGISELELSECELEDINLQDIPENVSSLSFYSCNLEGVGLKDLPKTVFSLGVHYCDVGEELRHIPPTVSHLELFGKEFNLESVPKSVAFLNWE
ncbi:MAG: F-box protein, partial [Chlamydiota bacterium]